MKKRVTFRTRYSEPHIQFTPPSGSKRTDPFRSFHVPSSDGRRMIGLLTNNKLLEEVIKLEKENERIERENLFYSRFLRRINRPKILETFDEYEDESDVVHRERTTTINQTPIQAKLPDYARRSELKRMSTTGATARSPMWSKLAFDWREHILKPFLILVERERLSIAIYELEQSKLDRERMQMNAGFARDHLKVLLRAAKSDITTQETLNLELNKRIDRYRIRLGEEKFNDPHLTIPAEMVIGRINKRISSRLSLIGRLRVNTARVELRLRSVNQRIHELDALREQNDQVDVMLVYRRQIDHIETDKKLKRDVIIEKGSLGSSLKCLQANKEFLIKQESNLIESDKKCQSMEYLLQKTNFELENIQQECLSIEIENEFLRNRMADILAVPTITNYARIIHQDKQLQREMDIWTKRVNIAETLLSQLKQQSQPPSFLPPLQSVVVHRH